MRRTVWLAAALVGCGGATAAGPSAAPTAHEAVAEATSACGWTPADVRAAPRVGVQGMRLRVRLPAGYFQPIGMPALAHPCGPVLVMSEVPPGLPTAERDAFMEGMINGVLDSSANAGSPCESVAGDAWHCGGATRLRAIRGEVWGVLQIGMSGLSPAAADAIEATLDAEPTAAWDPAAAMQVAFEPPAGMALDPLTSPPMLRYAPAADAPEEGNPMLIWAFLPYAGHPAHRDGSPWSDEEIGRAIGQLAIDQLGVTEIANDPSDVQELRTTELGTDVDVSMPGRRGDEEVAVYMAFFREPVGAFVGFGVTPIAKRGQFVERVRTHARTYRVMVDPG